MLIILHCTSQITALDTSPIQGIPNTEYGIRNAQAQRVSAARRAASPTSARGAKRRYTT